MGSSLNNYVTVASLVLLFVTLTTSRPMSEDSSVLVPEDSHDGPEVTSPSQNCQSVLTTRIETCLEKFEQLYITYRNPEASGQANRADLASRMCREYEETLYCLHLVFLGCKPGTPHLNLMERRIGSPQMLSFIKGTCNPSSPKTTLSTSSTTAVPTPTTSIPEVDSTTVQLQTSTNSLPKIGQTTTKILMESTTSSPMLDLSQEDAARADKHQQLAERQGKSTGTDAENPNFTLHQENGYIKFEIDQPRNDNVQESAPLKDNVDCSLSANKNKEFCKNTPHNSSTTSAGSLLLTLLLPLSCYTMLFNL